MRQLVPVSLILLATSLATATSGCDDCNRPQLFTARRSVTSDTRFQDPSGTWQSEPGGTDFYPRLGYGGTARVTAPQTFAIAWKQTYSPIDSAAQLGPWLLQLELTVQGVAPGPAEVDFDGGNGALTMAYDPTPVPDLHGHLSITTFSQNCSDPGNSSDCLLAMHGTFMFAAGQNGVDQSTGTFDAADGWAPDPQACQRRLGE
jgi:hypothetical protein